jgi:hypothetical protein
VLLVKQYTSKSSVAFTTSVGFVLAKKEKLLNLQRGREFPSLKELRCSEAFSFA